MIGRELSYYQAKLRALVYENKGAGHTLCEELLEASCGKEPDLMYCGVDSAST